MSGAPAYLPYEPQLVPVERAPGVWTVEGPPIDYRFAGLTLPCPTRMTVIRLADASLWLHSPVEYSPALAKALDALGPVRALVAPNGYHTEHTPHWASHYPAASLFAPAGVLDRPGFERGTDLASPTPPPWAAEIEGLLVPIGAFAEYVFMHRETRTLIVTDLMQNFEAERIASPFKRLVMRIGGATGPVGGRSIDVRLAARGHRAELREAVQRMIAWQPARIILSHGRCYDHNAGHGIERAFKGLI